MEILIEKDRESAAAKAADLVARHLRRKPDAVLGLATGETPRGLYRELVRRHAHEGLSFARVTTFNLDEYLGVAPEHPGSYHRYMRDVLVDHVDVDPSRVHLPDGLTTNVEATCAAYEESIRRAGGIDLQVLGVGRDGHIGFNEPSSSLGSRTRVKTLTPETRRDNAAAFGGEEQTPKHVLTMGIRTILETKRCLVLAFGETKAEVVRRMVEGPITASVPASALQLHEHVHVFLDEAAASRLERRDYYRFVSLNKPEASE